MIRPIRCVVWIYLYFREHKGRSSTISVRSIWYKSPRCGILLLVVQYVLSGMHTERTVLVVGCMVYASEHAQQAGYAYLAEVYTVRSERLVLHPGKQLLGVLAHHCIRFEGYFFVFRVLLLAYRSLSAS